MKLLARLLFSLFFVIAIGVHVYYVLYPDHKPLWWHALYFLTYASCWRMLFSEHRHSVLIYTLMALFPFITHLYYGWQHSAHPDGVFWVCMAVCIFLPAGAVWLMIVQKEKKAVA